MAIKMSCVTMFYVTSISMWHSVFKLFSWTYFFHNIKHITFHRKIMFMWREKYRPDLCRTLNSNYVLCFCLFSVDDISYWLYQTTKSVVHLSSNTEEISLQSWRVQTFDNNSSRSNSAQRYVASADGNELLFDVCVNMIIIQKQEEKFQNMT